MSTTPTLLATEVRLTLAISTPAGATFIDEVEEGSPGDHVVITINDQTFRDFGSPDVITVKVEPGDLLNDGSR